MSVGPSLIFFLLDITAWGKKKSSFFFFFLPTVQEADEQERKGRCEKWDIRNGAVNKEAEEEQNKKRHFGFFCRSKAFFTHHSPRLPPPSLFVSLACRSARMGGGGYDRVKCVIETRNMCASHLHVFFRM